jgi:hypothetical protein
VENKVMMEKNYFSLLVTKKKLVFVPHCAIGEKVGTRK